MKVELKSRAAGHIPGDLVAVAEVPAAPEPPAGLMWGERYFHRTAVDGFAIPPRAIYTEGELLILPSEAVQEGGAS